MRKSEIEIGKPYFYVTRECVLPKSYLHNNNLYMFDKRELNSNYKEVEAILAEAESVRETDAAKADELVESAKRMAGYFAEHGRVKIKKLRGVASSGYIFTVDELVRWKPQLKEYFETHPLEDMIDTFFDTVDGEEFVHAYIPKTNAYNNQRKGNRGDKKGRKNERKFEHLIPGKFKPHYDTDKLGDNMFKIEPQTKVNISVKVHGTSAVFSNVLSNNPINIPWYKRAWNNLVDYTLGWKWLKNYRFADSEVGYDYIYSSRNVIKNEYINLQAKENKGYYGTDVWGEYNDLFKQYDIIPKGYTIYGEIFGYISGDDKMIQKNYDYGCERGTNKFMPYRISEELEDGSHYEWNVSEVREWTEHIMETYPQIADRLYPIDILYHGTLGDLYPEVDVHTHWQENVLIAMKNDKKCLGMELNEPLCKNKVPREGVCIRIDNDPINECFKLKTDAFAVREAKEMDNGTVDIEMTQTDYGTDGSDEAAVES